jgi:FAD/FMN-containing dehydrogenase
MSRHQEDFLKVLFSVLDETVLFMDDRIPEKARSDASQTGRTLPLVYIRPVSVEQVAAALRVCNVYGYPVVAQGGMTGLAGGANAGIDEIAIAMDLLAGIEDIDIAAGTMTVLAGTVLEVAQKAAEEVGFLLPIDLGARGSCQIGGNLSTNAGGIRVVTHGVTRDNVLGLEAVLADGTVISSLNRMQKNNTGYDLKQLFIGSEGTLGIITRAVLKLKPLPTGQATALCGVARFEDVVAFLHEARKRLQGLSAFELMWETFFRFSREAEGLAFFEADYPFTVIIEQSGGEEGGLEAFLGGMFEQGLLADALIAQSEKERERFWKVREGAALDNLPRLINFDVSLPIGELDIYAGEVTAALEQEFPGIHVSVFGHVADSNIHLCISAGAIDDATEHRIDTVVYEHVRAHQGSISAEHGIGVLKRDYLPYSRSEEELELMRRIKLALDPKGILNRGKVLPVK